MDAHPIQQSIREIDVYTDADSDILFFRVGRNDVTCIEACTKPGLHCDIPYVRVWKGDVCEAEFCQHNIVGVYFAEPDPCPPNQPTSSQFDEIDPDCKQPHADAKSCPYCWIPF